MRWEPGMLVGVRRPGAGVREEEVRREPEMLMGVRMPGAGMREDEVRREPGGAGMREEEEGRGTGAEVGVVVAVEGDMVKFELRLCVGVCVCCLCCAGCVCVFVCFGCMRRKW